MSDSMVCVHHWLLDEQRTAGTIVGRCLKCGSQRQFPSSVEEGATAKLAAQRDNRQLSAVRS